MLSANVVDQREMARIERRRRAEEERRQRIFDPRQRTMGKYRTRSVLF